MLTVKNADGLPGEMLHLLVTRNVLDPSEVKFFLSNAPPDTSVETLLLVAFSRWHVERCFEDDKSEIGMDQYEGRRYVGLKRHLILSAVSYLFLARVRQEKRGEKPRADRLPTAHGHRGGGMLLGVVISPSGDEATGESCKEDHVVATSERDGSRRPHAADPKEAACARNQALQNETLPLANLAL
jgi:hypothetical protein